LGSTATSMSSPLAKNASPRRLPRVIVLAVALWVLSAVLRAVPLHALLALAPTSGPAWYFTRYYPGWWLVLPLQALLAVFLLRGHAWSRLAVVTLVLGLLLVQLSPLLAPQFGSFPLGAARESLVVALHVATVVLLFLPSANRWFGRRWLRSAA
jgi:hypothetical protein